MAARPRALPDAQAASPLGDVVLTVPEVAKLVKTSTFTVYAAIREKALTAHAPGGTGDLRLFGNDVLAWIKAGTGVPDKRAASLAARRAGK